MCIMIPNNDIGFYPDTVLDVDSRFKSCPCRGTGLLFMGTTESLKVNKSLAIPCPPHYGMIVCDGTMTGAELMGMEQEVKPMRNPVTEPRVGDVWITPLGPVAIVDPEGFAGNDLVGVRGMDGRWFTIRLWLMCQNGDAHPALIIPLELAQRMMQYGNEIKGGAGYIADDLTRYMPQNEVVK